MYIVSHWGGFVNSGYSIIPEAQEKVKKKLPKSVYKHLVVCYDDNVIKRMNVTKGKVVQ